MGIIATDRYDHFVSSASHELQARGAHPLVPNRIDGNVPGWLRAWDHVLFNDAPGAAAIYAFTSGGAVDVAELQSRVDALAGGLAAAGFFRGPPISLVAVVVFLGAPNVKMRRASERLVPRTFIPGLRPSSVAVDLTESRITGRGGGSIRPVLENALSGEVRLSVSQSELDRRREAFRARTVGFYDLMRGRQPIATYGLVLVNVVIFLAMLYTGGQANAVAVLHGGAMGDTVAREWGAQSPALIEQGQWWRFGSELFLHASITHIVFNMASLLAVGSLAERLYGSTRFLAIYLGAGLIASFASFVFAVSQGSMSVLGVGASGAIFGVAGALLTVRFQQSDVIPFEVRRRVTSSMVPLVAISLAIAAFTPYVDNSAHVGGLLGGMALSFCFPLTKRVPAAK
ncbi:MAG TPA: rhomboid family intramembrane serine protease [Chloroflexota bacterium]